MFSVVFNSGWKIHEHLQSGVCDSAAGPLEWMLAVVGSHAPGLPTRQLGSSGRTPGEWKSFGDEHCITCQLQVETKLFCWCLYDQSKLILVT